MSDSKKTTEYSRTRERGDPILADVLDLLDGQKVSRIAAKSGISQTTIYNWRRRKTRCPQNLTIEFALRAAGYTRKIVKL